MKADPAYSCGIGNHLMTFNDDEVEEHVRQTAGRRKNVDYDRQKLMRELKGLALRGDEQADEARLLDADITRGSKRWQEFKAVFQAFQQPR
jgi:hypothetical protein